MVVPFYDVWMRCKLGGGKGVIVYGIGKMGPKEIGHLITMLEVQKAVLEEEDPSENAAVSFPSVGEAVLSTKENKDG